jgi:AmiR/NasT family two-component response regulator
MVESTEQPDIASELRALRKEVETLKKRLDEQKK